MAAATVQLAHVPLDVEVFDDVLDMFAARCLRFLEGAIVCEQDVGAFVIDEALNCLDQLVGCVIRDEGDVYALRLAGSIVELNECLAPHLGDWYGLLRERCDDNLDRLTQHLYLG